MNNNFHVAHLGTSGFPYGFGAMQRIILLCKGLQEAGAEVLVINRKGRHKKESGYDLQLKGEFEDIQYIYTSKLPYKPAGFFERSWQKVIGFWQERKLLWQLKRAGKLDAISLYLTGEFHYLLYYSLLAKSLGVPMVLHYVEYRSVWPSRSDFRTRLNDRLFDRYATRLADATLPISEFLIKKVEETASGKPMLKIPIICDYDKFSVEENPAEAPYFLFVGAASYLEPIKFVVVAFQQLGEYAVPLKLVLGGNSTELKRVNSYISTLDCRDHITVVPNVPHHEIPKQLSQACALLIPLRETLQDAARFPHKIGEYIASGRPIITTAFGEIPVYFKDEENALIADSYDMGAFSKKMDFILKHPERSKTIGINGRMLGEQQFDYKKWGRSFYQFLVNLTSKKTEVRSQTAALSEV